MPLLHLLLIEPLQSILFSLCWCTSICTVVVWSEEPCCCDLSQIGGFVHMFSRNKKLLCVLWMNFFIQNPAVTSYMCIDTIYIHVCSGLVKVHYEHLLTYHTRDGCIQSAYSDMDGTFTNTAVSKVHPMASFLVWYDKSDCHCAGGSLVFRLLNILVMTPGWICYILLISSCTHQIYLYLYHQYHSSNMKYRPSNSFRYSKRIYL